VASPAVGEYNRDMGKTVGYMLTWTTYGTWLQGDERGYVKNGKILCENPRLKKANVESMLRNEVRLNKRQQEIVKEAIFKEAEKTKEKILALAVCSNHIHLVLCYTIRPIEKTTGRFKNAARVALQQDGFIGRVWARGFDKRYCFDEKSLKNRIDYVERHER
jgi:REP element-mobilizing transposase RayT